MRSEQIEARQAQIRDRVAELKANLSRLKNYPEILKPSFLHGELDGERQFPAPSEDRDEYLTRQKAVGPEIEERLIAFLNESRTLSPVREHRRDRSRSLRIGIVADRFLYNSLKYAVRLIPITPQNFAEELEGVDILLVTSAWRGMDGEWINLPLPNSPARRVLEESVAPFAREKGIPVVFYSNEDAPDFQKFAEIARLAEHVFTSAGNRVVQYKEVLGPEVPVNVLGSEIPISEPSRADPSVESRDGALAEQPFVSMGLVLPGTHLELPTNTYLRLDVLSGNVVVPALIWVNADHRDRLLVATNGAVSRRSAKDPSEVFQRRTWVEDIEASVVFLADPTLQSDNTISIGWGQGGPGAYAIPAMAQTAQYIAGLLEVPSGRRVYFGSSAGGFQALQLGIRDSEAKVLVNNAQFDWTRYEPMNVRSICRHSYSGAAVERVAKAHLGRTSVIEAAREQGRLPRIRYLLNAASPDDCEKQLPAVIAALGREADLTLGGALDVALYSDPKTQHNPISKSRTLAEINSAFERCLDRP